MRVAYILSVLCAALGGGGGRSNNNDRGSSSSSFLFASSLAVVAPPTKARPVIVGTSPYCNVLFGKLQRAASLWGTNLRQPMSIIDESVGDSGNALEKCLWGQFGMSDSGADGKLDLEDLLLPLNSYTPNSNIKDAILFFDGTAPRTKSPGAAVEANQFFSNLFSKPKKKVDDAPKNMVEKMEDTATTSIVIDPKVLDCSQQRGSAHWYILASHATLESCQELLSQYIVPSTIVCIDPPETLLKPKPSWVSSRPQNMEGEFQNPIQLDSEPSSSISSSILAPPLPDFIYSEDVAELMLQISLRTERKVAEQQKQQTTPTRLVFLRPSSEELLEERPNSDYFTMTGGPKAKAAAGTIRTVSNWKSLLSPLGGQINDKLGKRPGDL